MKACSCNFTKFYVYFMFETTVNNDGIELGACRKQYMSMKCLLVAELPFKYRKLFRYQLLQYSGSWLGEHNLK